MIIIYHPNLPLSSASKYKTLGPLFHYSMAYKWSAFFKNELKYGPNKKLYDINLRALFIISNVQGYKRFHR
jgi:hypothetical protein